MNDLIELASAEAAAVEPFPIRVYPDPVLRQVAVPVTAFDAALAAKARRMAATLLARRGAGLAASQIGEALRLFVVLERAPVGDDDDEADESAAPAAATGAPAAPAVPAAPPPPPPPALVRVLVNPELVESRGTQDGEERCLSFPPDEIQAKIRRAAEVRVRYQDLAGAPAELEAEGFPARVLLHELDHLEGVLFVDRASTVKRFALRRHLKAMEADFRAGGVGDGQR